MKHKFCTVDGCERAHYGKGLCAKHYASTWAKANPELRSAASKRDYLKRADACKANARKWEKANPGRKRELNRKYRTGFTPELVCSLRGEQNSRCAICESLLTEPGGADKGANHVEHADHCHATNTPRGLLCGRCNKLLGHYEKNRDLFSRFDAYLAFTPVMRLRAAEPAE